VPILGGVLAHAFYPEDGRCHFDEGEVWTVNTTGANLFIIFFLRIIIIVHLVQSFLC
jgi:hypothetical protein